MLEFYAKYNYIFLVLRLFSVNTFKKPHTAGEFLGYAFHALTVYTKETS